MLLSSLDFINCFASYAGHSHPRPNFYSKTKATQKLGIGNESVGIERKPVYEIDPWLQSYVILPAVAAMFFHDPYFCKLPWSEAWCGKSAMRCRSAHTSSSGRWSGWHSALRPSGLTASRWRCWGCEGRWGSGPDGHARSSGCRTGGIHGHWLCCWTWNTDI